ncbi:MAG: gliding motility-associated C-terminal domain-containing protein [Chitinophagales bacterium]|nr:gliding motility-associated C-terminal domain-containing protein [Chitinophagales bacterium]
MNIRLLLGGIFFCLPQLLTAQNCPNPITLDGVLVTNTLCGVSTGTVIITPNGNAGSYSYGWTPNVSNSNVALNLAAGTYKVHITRNNNPNCTLDTLILVNNSNGPQVTATIGAAQCLANNGTISLSPANLLYNWSNGGNGPSIAGLQSKNYYVTVTNPSNGCFSVFKYFVPRDLNALNVSAQVLNQSKCGKNNGRALVSVNGGSGQYTYNPGPGPQYNNLAPGNHTVQVLDLVTGCSGSVSFTIQDLPVSGSVSVTPNNGKCAGQSGGFVSFDVTPGANFTLPYVFTLEDALGNSYSPGSLPGGQYFLQILDADGCPLPEETFVIQEPPAFNSQVQAFPETCVEKGQIQLQISGGNGSPFLVNWTDMPGDDNPEDRTNLAAGIYSAVVYDSLFCAYPLNNIQVLGQCSSADLVHLVLPVNSSDVYCVPRPVGLPQAGTVFGLVGGGSNGNSAYGSWVLNNNGCLTYQAGSLAGFAVDTICVKRSAAALGLNDTVCVVVSITQQALSKQAVFFTVQVDESASACGTIPPGFSTKHVVQLGRPGLSGTSDVFGQYQIDAQSACLAFFANQYTGNNVDEIRVGVLDTLNNRCHQITYYPTILPEYDCSSALVLGTDTLQLTTTDCNVPAGTCVPIPLDEMVQYNIIDNGTLYNGGLGGCNEGLTTRYNFGVLPSGGGPYQLQSWLINGQTYNGNFLNFNGLLNLMNQLDPPPNGWSVQGSGQIRGGEPGGNYGAITIQSATGVTEVYMPSVVTIFKGSELRFLPGPHEVVFRNVQTACSDTMLVSVQCQDCPPIHSYPLNGQGMVRWSVSDCLKDTIFCTNALNAELGQYQVTDNGIAFLDFALCGNFVGLNLDTGMHQLHFFNPSTTCEWDVMVEVQCSEVISEQYIPVSVLVGSTVTICLDSTTVTGPVTGIVNICEDEGSNTIGYGFDVPEWCVQITGQNPGMDTLCVQLCNALDECANFFLIVQVTTAMSDSLQVYQGISPNGDGKNDVWLIPGIEQYPNNVVQIFNRWGNLVYEQKGYTNNDPWTGQWNGKELPDGTYFYLIELGNNAGRLSGWVVVQR